MPERITVEVDGRRLTLSHLDKPLWPEFTKGEALDYYARVADALLPHTRNRAASFVRFPEGVGGERFYAKNPPGGTPPWVSRVDVPSKSEGTKAHVSVDDRPSLMALANLYCLEIHVPQWNGTDGAELHDRLVVDLDPGEGADLTDCCRVALLIREALAADGLDCVPVTSGSKGLHLYAPLLPSPAEAVLGYARRMAERLAVAHPKLVVARMTKALRPGKVFVDWSQNNTAKTTSTPYTLRATSPAPGVSTPVTWDEVAGCTDPAQLAFGPDEVLDRIAASGDLALDLLEPTAATVIPVD